ncbi:hypothetical protein [Streptomyces sp. NPDC060205]
MRVFFEGTLAKTIYDERATPSGTPAQYPGGIAGVGGEGEKGWT